MELRSRRENLRRNSFLIGLAVLLVLIAGSGVLAFTRLGAFEATVRERSRMNARHLEAALEIQEQIGLLEAEARTYFTALALGSWAEPSKRRMDVVRGRIDAIVEKENTSVLGQYPEWAEFQRAYESYADDLDVRRAMTDDGEALQERLDIATSSLIDRIKESSAQLDVDASRMRDLAQRDVLVTTTICFLAGLAISILAFTETKRRIELIENAFVGLVRWKEFAESVLDGMDSGVLTVDERGLVTSVNSPALYALGISSESDVVGRPVVEVLAGQTELLAMVHPLVGEHVASRRYLGRIELGRGPWLFDVGASPLGPGAASQGFILTLADVTEAERASQELRRNRALSAIGQMTAQVAHEIKNPLGGVRLSAQLLGRRLRDDPESLELVRRIESSIDHLARTVTELNQFARPSELKLEPCSLPVLLDELLLAVADKVKEKSIVVDRVYDPGLPEGVWDEGELRKAFINFLVNALDASLPSSRLRVAAGYRSQPVEAAVVEIKDEGAGMSEETLRRLFEPFYTTKAHGTGLGMSIARKIIELHKGTLEVSSREGVGTMVLVTLPLNTVGSPAPAPLTDMRAGS